MKENDSILQKVASYYENKVAKHGATSKGVDWNGNESQFLRFSILSKLFTEETFKVIDYGCGYGAYIDFLNENFANSFTYKGFDIATKMIDAAKEKYPSHTFTDQLSDLSESDYLVSSGILNVKNETSEENWKTYFFDQINQMDKLVNKGFSFNALTKYSDKEYMRPHLYYADPLEVFDYCKKHFSRNVALLHDYELYEFTIIVRK